MEVKIKVKKLSESAKENGAMRTIIFLIFSKVEYMSANLMNMRDSFMKNKKGESTLT